MQALKTVAKIVGILFFHVGLWILLSFFVFSRFFAAPDYILQTAEESAVYKAAAEEVIKTTAEEQGANISGIVVSEEEYQLALGSVITADFLQTQAEAMISGLYEWLEGNTEVPTFTLDAENERESLATVFSGLAIERLEELPDCTSAEQLRANTGPEDITCVPPEFNAEEARGEIQQELLESTDFFTDTELSSEELFGDEVDFKGSDAPKEFERAKKGWIYAGIILVLSAGAIVLTSGSRRKAARTISMQLVIVGVGFALLALVGLVINSTVPVAADLNDLQLAGVHMLKDFTSVLSRIVLVFAGALTLVGVGGILLSRPEKEQNENSRPEVKTIQK